MAVVGDAYVVVRAITNRVVPDIQNALKGIDSVGLRAGRDLSDGINRGISSGVRGDSLNNLEKELLRARDKFQRLITAGYLLGPALTALAGIIGALGNALVVLGAAAINQAGAGLTILGAVLGSVAQAAVTARLAFSGVSKAISAGIKSQQGGVAATKAREAAERSLLASQDAYADAQIATERAERAYRDSQEKTIRAVKRLEKAREDATEKLQQLRFETEGGAISEKKARLEYEKARESLQRIQDLPPNSRARREAQIAYEEADLNLRKAIDRNSDLKKEEKAATAAGVEGSQEVLDAKTALRDATEGEQDSRIDLAKTQRSELRALQALTAAQNENTSSADAYADSLSNLSDEAQNFVKYIVSIQDEFKKLKDAAGEELFPKLEIAIQNLVDNLFPTLQELLRGTGDVLGDLAIDFSETLTEATNLANLETVWKNNDQLLRDLGVAAGNYTGGLLALFAAAEPLIKQFGDWIVTLSGTWEETMKAKQASGELTETFERMGEIASDFGEIFRLAFDGLGDVVAALVEPGGGLDVLTTYLKDSLGAFKEFTAAGREDGSLKEFFIDATKNVTKLLNVIGKIGKVLLNIAAGEGFGIFLDKFGEAVDIFGEIGEALDDTLPSLGDLVITFAELTKTFTDSGAIKTFLDTLNVIGQVLNAVFGTKTAQFILGIAGGFFAVYRAFNLAGKGFSFISKAFRGSLLGFQKGLTGAGVKLNTFGASLAAKGGMLGGFGAKVAGAGGKLVGFAGKLGGVGRAFSLLGGPIGIILLVLPLIIENWDKIVEFLQGLIAKLGKIFTAMWSFLSKAVTDAWNAVTNYWTRTVVPWFTGLASAIGKLVATVWNWLKDGAVAAWGALIKWFKIVWDWYTFLPRTVFKLAGKVWNFLLDKIKSIWQTVSGFFNNTVFGFLGNLVSKFKNSAGNIWNFLIDALRGAWELAKNWWNNNVASKKLRIGGFEIFGKKLPSFTLGLPKFAKGGVVPAIPGGMLGILGEAGKSERIEPLDANGLSKRDKAMIDYMGGGSGGGTTINVYPSPGMDERELASLVSRQLAFQLRKGAA